MVSDGVGTPADGKREVRQLENQSLWLVCGSVPQSSAAAQNQHPVMIFSCQRRKRRRQQRRTVARPLPLPRRVLVAPRTRPTRACATSCNEKTPSPTRAAGDKGQARGTVDERVFRGGTHPPESPPLAVSWPEGSPQSQHAGASRSKALELSGQPVPGVPPGPARLTTPPGFAGRVFKCVSVRTVAGRRDSGRLPRRPRCWGTAAWRGQRVTLVPPVPVEAGKLRGGPPTGTSHAGGPPRLLPRSPHLRTHGLSFVPRDAHNSPP